MRPTGVGALRAQTLARCDHRYLLQQMATKTLCEAVVEGMGSVWEKCALAERHPDFKTSVEEAVIAWSAPQP